jgi:hypothetical protein
LLCGDPEVEEEILFSPDCSARFFKLYSGTGLSPLVLLDIRDDDPDDLLTLQEEVPPL